MIEDGVAPFMDGDHGGVHVVAGDPTTPAGDDAGPLPATATNDVEGSCGCSVPERGNKSALGGLALVGLLLRRRAARGRR